MCIQHQGMDAGVGVCMFLLAQSTKLKIINGTKQPTSTRFSVKTFYMNIFQGGGEVEAPIPIPLPPKWGWEMRGTLIDWLIAL